MGDPAWPGVIFKRTPGSGGWADPDARAAFRTAGDLVTNAGNFPFAVEVKRREGWKLDILLVGRRSPVWAWWLQAQAAAREMKLQPALWIRKNHTPWYVMLPEQYWYSCADEREAALAVAAEWKHQDLLPRKLGLHPILLHADRLLKCSPTMFLPIGD
jgi:hypothetical protein